MSKLSLAQLAEHLELLAEAQDIITRLSPHLTSGGYQDDLEVTRETTAVAGRVLRSLAPFEDDLRIWLRDKICKAKESNK